MFMSFCGHKFSFLLGKYFVVGLLGHMVFYIYIYKKLPNFFSSWLYNFSLTLAMYESSSGPKYSSTFDSVNLYFPIAVLVCTSISL